VRVAITLEQCWHDVPGGTGVYGIEVARELATLPGLEVIGVAGRHRSPATAGFAPPIGVRALPLAGPFLYESWLRFGWPRVEAATGAVDVVHATSIIPAATSLPLVVTVHDLAFLHDPSHFTKRGVSVFRRSMDLVKSRAARVVCVSQATLDDCLDHGFDAERLRCVENGVRPVVVSDGAVRDVVARHRLPERYLLFVGTIEPRKNLARLIEAHAMLGDRIPDLVVVGAAGWGETIEVPAASRARVHMTGFVSADDLAALYSGAVALCYPSIREGFGLPILEAMAQGTPVVTSANGATEEVAGGAAVLVDPMDVASIADGILRVIEQRDVLSARARDRAAQLSWKRTAQLTREVYAEAIADGPRTARRGDR
jgi:glycosyltransferase involved in cell wall biosynthesis